MGGLLHVLGIDAATGPWYAFWSGLGAIILPPLLTAAPIVWVLLRRHNCEVHRCWRLGRHATGAGHMVCRHHHPAGPLLPEHVK